MQFPCNSRSIQFNPVQSSSIQFNPVQYSSIQYNSVPSWAIPMQFPCNSRAIPVQFPCNSCAIPVQPSLIQCSSLQNPSAPSPLAGQLPPQEGMPGGPMPTGFFPVSHPRLHPSPHPIPLPPPLSTYRKSSIRSRTSFTRLQIIYGMSFFLLNTNNDWFGKDVEKKNVLQLSNAIN